MGIKDSITAPITNDQIEETKIDTGNVDGHIRSGVVERDGSTYFLEVVYTGNTAVARGIADALRTKTYTTGHLLVKQRGYKWNERLRMGEYTDSITRQQRSLVVPEQYRSNWVADGIPRDRRQHQLIMYPKSSTFGSTETTYFLFFEWGMTEEQMQNKFFADITSRCTTVCVAPEWVPEIWKWMQQIDLIKQIDSFGWYVGFTVRFDEPAMRQFITRMIRTGEFRFPAVEDKAENEQEAA